MYVCTRFLLFRVMEDVNPCVIHIIPMTRAEYLGKEKKLTISYSQFTVPTGKFLVASTPRGICFLMPAETKWHAVDTLKKNFPKARFRCQKIAIHRKAASIMRQRYDKVGQLFLHLMGTAFQINVWQDLLSIPLGKVTTYLNIAQRIGNPRAARAVGQAVGSNPVMGIIPCHRVICSNGKLGGFHWGIDKKIKILNKETIHSKNQDGFSNWEPMLF